MTDIVSRFQFDDTEKRIFPETAEYAALLENWLALNKLDHSQITRFMILSLFFEYRATNHQGENFTTDPSDWTLGENRKKVWTQLECVNQLLGHAIMSSEEYVDLIFEKFPARYTGADFFDFVTTGKKIGSRDRGLN